MSDEEKPNGLLSVIKFAEDFAKLSSQMEKAFGLNSLKPLYQQMAEINKTIINITEPIERVNKVFTPVLKLNKDFQNSPLLKFIKDFNDLILLIDSITKNKKSVS